MIRYLGSWLWYKLSLNLVGAWYLIREQVGWSEKGQNIHNYKMLGVGPSQPPASSGRPRREAGCGDWRGQGYWGEGCQEAGTCKMNRES